MKKVFFAFLLGMVAGAGLLYYFEHGNPEKALEQTRHSVTGGAARVKGVIQEHFGDVSVDEIKRELERTGTVVREKASQAGTVIADATGNARITGTIKTKLLNDMGTAALHINVDTTDGLVTLSGTAESHNDVAKAVKIALETEGVVKVISTIQVKPAAK